MKRLAPPLFILLCLGGLTWVCYGRVLGHDEQFGYRDAAHYYYPLYQRVQAEWNAGRWPLWEPEENGGMPLLGNPTAAVLYPGKVVYAIFSYPVAARLYVVAHTLLAFVAMLALLRSWKTSWEAAAIGAFGYAFGGPILFQYCNIIYLVGAAWVPLGFRAVDRWLRLRKRFALLELAVVLAMETLGGDPEMAYLTGLCAGGYALALAWNRGRGDDARQARWTRPYALVPMAMLTGVSWCVLTLAMAHFAPGFREARKADQPTAPLPWMYYAQPILALFWATLASAVLVAWRRARRSATGGQRPIRILLPMLCGLAASAVLAGMLSAAQLLPVFEFTRQTGRSAVEGAHEIHTFSLEPLRLPEFLWPNFFGTSFHGNRSWLMSAQLTSKAMKVWVPTLYIGVLTLVLALAGMRWRWSKEDPWRSWMTVVAVVSLLAAFGEFTSPIYWARFSKTAEAQIGAHDTDETTPIRADKYLRDGDGSFYWALATVLPGFRQFRFPSKLLTLTVMALSALAAGAWDEVSTSDRPTRRRALNWAIGLSVLTALALTMVSLFRASITARLSRSQLNNSFGPFDGPGAFLELRGALIQSMIMLLLVLFCVTRARRQPILSASMALVLLAVDLGWANSRYVFTVPQSIMDAPSEVAGYIEQAEKERPSPGPYRVHRLPLWGPISWREQSSNDRVLDFVRWERRTIQPKYGITEGIHYTQTRGVAELFDYEWFFGGFHRKVDQETAAYLGVAPGDEVIVYPRRAFDMWTTRYFVLPFYPNHWNDEARAYGSMLENTEVVYPIPGTFSEDPGSDRARDWIRTSDFQVRRNIACYPRAWVVHQARFIPNTDDVDRQSRNGPIQDILYSGERLWRQSGRAVFDPRQIVWIDERQRESVQKGLSQAITTSNETAAITRYEPTRVEIDATLESPGMLVLADTHYPGWTLTIDGVSAPIYQANRMMRGALVPSGRHQLVYTYRPRSFRLGLGLSIAGLLALTAFGAFFLVRPR
jgi:Bacterial membrane protein YfhO